MNRRDFLKSAFALAAFSRIAGLSAKAGPDGDKSSDCVTAGQVTRRRYRNTAMTVPLIGFGTMRLPTIGGDMKKIDYAVTERMIDAAMKAGCNYFDTAYMYHGGESEICMGKVLKKYPRDSYYLASKMPVWFAKNRAGVERLFNEQLRKCQTEYFDFYMLHSLDSGKWAAVQKYGALEFLLKMKEQGKIRKLGFSFHDSPEVLKTIVKAHPWDFAQIQLNYLDWTLYRSKEQYEIVTEAGIPVIVMEPLRGGALARLSPDAVSILKNADPKASTASWGFRWCATLPNVLCILSGMSLPEHVEDNMRTFMPFVPLSDKEKNTLELALAAYRKK